MRITKMKDLTTQAYDRFARPSKDLYFMNLCFEVAKRSIDSSTKCGCVFVDAAGGILSTGYNGPVRNAIDENVPLDNSDKYLFLEHSERNSIYNAARVGTPLNGSIVYVTGFPCIDCLRGIIQVGAVKIVYGPLQAKMCSSPEYLSVYPRMLTGVPITIRRFKFDKELFELQPGLEEVCRERNDIKLEFFLSAKK